MAHAAVVKEGNEKKKMVLQRGGRVYNPLYETG